LLAASQAQIANSQANIDLARAQRRPNIGLSIGSLLRNPVSFAGRFALSLGLGLSQTLFDSGRSRSQINEAQALLEQSRSGLANQELNVGNQIEQSLLSLDSAQARTVSADAAVTSAQEALRAAQVAYQAGVRTSLEVSTAQTALLNAQTNAVNARFDVANGQAQLASAVGVLTTEAQAAAARTNQAQAAAAAAQAQLIAAQPKKKRKKFLGIF
jgi:outer membrane protein TolC